MKENREQLLQTHVSAKVANAVYGMIIFKYVSNPTMHTWQWIVTMTLFGNGITTQGVAGSFNFVTCRTQVGERYHNALRSTHLKKTSWFSLRLGGLRSSDVAISCYISDTCDVPVLYLSWSLAFVLRDRCMCYGVVYAVMTRHASLHLEAS